MNILLRINAQTALLCHEALSMAFALAAFDHVIQLQLGQSLIKFVTTSPEGKLAKMLSSLSLYDMPQAWVDASDIVDLTHWQTTQIQAFDWQTQLQPIPTQPDIVFDTIIEL